jgi:hypothetical protein
VAAPLHERASLCSPHPSHRRLVLHTGAPIGDNSRLISYAFANSSNLDTGSRCVTARIADQARPVIFKRTQLHRAATVFGVFFVGCFLGIESFPAPNEAPAWRLFELNNYASSRDEDPSGRLEAALDYENESTSRGVVRDAWKTCVIPAIGKRDGAIKYAYGPEVSRHWRPSRLRSSVYGSVHLGKGARRQITPSRRGKRKKEDTTSLFGGGSGWPRPRRPVRVVEGETP